MRCEQKRARTIAFACQNLNINHMVRTKARKKSVAPTICDFYALVFELHSIEFLDGLDCIFGTLIIDEPVTERVPGRLKREI